MKTSRKSGVAAKPAVREESEKAARAKMRRGRRPKVSAILAKKRRKAPELRLWSLARFNRSEKRHRR